MKVIELLIELVYHPISRSKMFDINRIYKMPYVHRVFQLCYRMIKFAIQDN